MQPGKWWIAALVVVAAVLASPVVRADEVTDQIDEALNAYKAKDYNGATTALDTAGSLIRQQAAEGMTRVLPKPLAGWEAEEAESAGGAAMFGAGTTASRRYTRMIKQTTAPGQPAEAYETQQQLDITVAANSPALQAMSMMFMNPAFAGPDAKVMMVGGRKTIFNKSDNSLMTLVNNQVLVTVDGDATVTMDDLKAYFGAIDFKTLEK